MREKWRRAFQRQETHESVPGNIDAELRAHLEMRVEQLKERGLSEVEARARATAMLGDVNSATVACERTDRAWLLRKRVGLLFGALRMDFAHALRIFRTSPLFAVLASLCMAVGITFTATTYTILDGTILNPLPFEDSDELVMVGQLSSAASDWTFLWTSYPDFRDWREENHVFEDLAVFNWRRYTITDLDDPVRMDASVVSEAFDDILRVRAALGRTFTSDDYAPGAEPVILLGHGIWQRAYGADPSVVGRQITLDGESRYRVVGVTPPGFAFPDFREAWLPAPPEEAGPRSNYNYVTFGRLRGGVALEAAQVEMREIGARIAARNPDTEGRDDVRVVRFGPYLFQSLSTPLLIIFFVACLVLLLACSNLANLMLARATGRAREISLRAVLGAGRGRLIQQLLVESLVLAAVGGVVGIVLGRLALHLLLANVPLAIPEFIRFEMNGRVLIPLAGIVLLSGIIFGLAPALTARRGALGTSLRNDVGRMSAGRKLTLVRSSLVVFQITLATIILAVTGVVVRSYLASRNHLMGVDTDHVSGQEIFLPQWAYPEGASRLSFFREAIDLLEARPEIETAAWVSQPPAARVDWTSRITTGQTSPDGQLLTIRSRSRIISPQYLAVTGLPLLSGRGFSEADVAGGTRVALINAVLAGILWPGEDPLGRHFTWLFGSREPDPQMATEIVGIVGDVRHGGPGTEPGPCLYVPLGLFNNPARGWLVARTWGDPAVLAPVFRETVQLLDDRLALTAPSTLAELAQAKNWRTIFATWVLTSVAVFALILALVGILGVVAYSVTNRMREFGIRLALGAGPESMLRSVLGKGAVMAGTGIAAGLVVAFAAMRFLASVLANTNPRDPVVYAAVVLFLAATTLVATYLPARRIVGIDPVEVLREE
jgi:putative ABC transport system permease protein